MDLLWCLLNATPTAPKPLGSPVLSSPPFYYLAETFGQVYAYEYMSVCISPKLWTSDFPILKWTSFKGTVLLCHVREEWCTLPFSLLTVNIVGPLEPELLKGNWFLPLLFFMTIMLWFTSQTIIWAKTKRKTFYSSAFFSFNK